MCIQKKEAIFSLLLSLVALLVEKENCQALRNKNYHDDYFEKGMLIVPKKPNRSKQDWEKKPQEQGGVILVGTSIDFNKTSKNFNISSFFEEDYSSGSKDMRDLFYNNEYGRD